MSYVAPIDEIVFTLDHICDARKLTQYDKYTHLDKLTIQAILAEASKLSTKLIEPVNASSDLIPPKLFEGKVICSPGFLDAYQAIADGGWVGMAASAKFGGMDLPIVIASCINEMLGSACLSLSLNPLMTQGQIEVLETFAPDEIKSVYLPMLNSGKWSGTMNLTEDNAGSDVGALQTTAVPRNDGTYEITGQKIYISWGEHDLTENICHLVLARLPNSSPGTKGISLFLVPKFLPGKESTIGERNKVSALSLENKMGLHGSPTVVMNYESAKGWMIGEPNGGMKAMFAMMNNARLGVGVQGISQAERALQKAIMFAKSRKQGKSMKKNGSGTIIDHADVRRNLLIMKALTTVGRSICLDTAVSTDFAKLSGDTKFYSRAAFLTPIAKSFGTDIGCRVCDLGIQIHGGLGYIESTGASQLYRDARITTIYEGTNGIQAMDLVNRKLSDGGETAHKFLADFENVEKICLNERIFEKGVIDEYTESRRNLKSALNWMLQTNQLNERYSGADAFLKAFSYVLGGYYLLKGAKSSKCSTRVDLANFYIQHLLPKADAELKSACRGSSSIYKTVL